MQQIANPCSEPNSVVVVEDAEIKDAAPPLAVPRGWTDTLTEQLESSMINAADDRDSECVQLKRYVGIVLFILNIFTL